MLVIRTIHEKAIRASEFSAALLQFWIQHFLPRLSRSHVREEGNGSQEGPRDGSEISQHLPLNYLARIYSFFGLRLFNLENGDVSPGSKVERDGLHYNSFGPVSDHSAGLWLLLFQLWLPRPPTLRLPIKSSATVKDIKLQQASQSIVKHSICTCHG